MRLIINADDFGLEENATLAILEAFSQGLVTTTTATVNMPYFRTAIEMAKERGLLDRIGFHFNIIEGPAMTEPIRHCARLCSPDGCFNMKFHQSAKTRLWLSTRERNAIGVEATAQMNAFVDSGAKLMHLDSHCHTHNDFSIASVLLPLAKKYGFTSVRPAMNLGLNSRVKRAYKAFINRYMASYVPITVNGMAGFDFFEKARAGLDGLYEMMVHPLYIKNGVHDMNGELCDTHTPFVLIKNLLKECELCAY